MQQVFLGLIALEATVKVMDAWDHVENGVRSTGFTYVTLEGHPERGIASFQIRLERDRQVVLLIDARSLPGTPVARLARPITRAFQCSLTRAALKRLTRFAVDGAARGRVTQDTPTD